MKRKIFLAMGLCLYWSSVQAAEDVEFLPNAQFRARYENWLTPSASSTNPENNSGVKNRVELDLLVRRGERLQMFVRLLYGSLLGSNTNGSAAATGSVNGNADTAAASFPTDPNNQNGVTVNRAWGWWKASDFISIKAGRIPIEFADGSVFSENDWEQVPTMHEGLLINYEIDFAKMGLYLIKTQELAYGASVGTTPGNPNWDPETNMYLLNFDIKHLPDVLKVANLNLAEITRDETTVTSAPLGNGSGRGLGPSLNEQRVSGVVSGEFLNIYYKLDAAVVVGSGKVRQGNGGYTSDQILTINQSMLDIKTGFHSAENMDVKVGVGFHRDSAAANVNNATTNPTGDLTLGTYDPFFYNRHFGSGLMDVVRWGGLTYYELNASFVPFDDFELGTAAYLFLRSASGINSSPITFGPNYPSLAGASNSTNSLNDTGVGQEIDVFANKTYDKSLSFAAHLGTFLPGSYLKDGFGLSAGAMTQTIYEGMFQTVLAF